MSRHVSKKKAKPIVLVRASVDDECDDIREDPVLNTVEFIFSLKSVKQGLKKTSKIRSFNTEIKVEVLMFSDVKHYQGIISKSAFDKCLQYYETKQDKYLEEIMIDGTASKLRALEAWFIGIQEPKPIGKKTVKEWKKRETIRLEQHRSYYCNLDLIPYLTKQSKS